jgi:hypothetical protein
MATKSRKSSGDLLTYDYSRSFVQWWMDTLNHSPRCAIHASCRLRDAKGKTREFFLTHPCMGEKMYADKDVIHLPTADFHIIFAPKEEFLIVKIMADDPPFLRLAHRVGEKVATHDGRGTTLTRMELTMRHFPLVRELRSDREVYDAMVANLPILGRIQFPSPDGKTEVICEFPVTVMNAMHDEGHRWQVDTGPILIPDFSIKSELAVARFRQAFVVYNSWDWVEFAARIPVKDPSTKAGLTCMHYASPTRLAAKNRLFCADI